MEERILKLRKIGITMVSIAIILIAFAGITQAATSTVRPISDFVKTQGTFCFPDGNGGCVIFVPPVKNYIGWSDPAMGISASIDYAGLADAWIKSASQGTLSFGTTMDGRIIEVPLNDGTGRVKDTVILTTKNALTYVISGGDFANGPLLFGHRAPDVLAGKDAALADVLMQVVFINTAPGAPMPDLIQLIAAPLPGQEFKSISIAATADGTLRSAFGVPDGTPGMASVTQIGVLFDKKFTGKTGDGFAVENIDLKVVGN
jgi:hypothetical protein